MYAVLVVDDESVVCQGIRDYLFESGLNISKVWTASNGYEALDYIRMEQIDLVLTDIQMDGMNGIELMGSIQSEKADLPVVVISAHDAFEYAQQCIRLGARDYLIKPVRLANLVQVVGRALTERHERYKQVLEDSLKLKFSMTGMSSLRTYMLNELISGALAEADDYAFIFEQIGVALDGPYYAVIVVDLQWERAGVSGAEVRSLRDRNLLKYAAVNIIEETLSDWNAVTFYGQGNRIVVVLQMSEAEYVRQSDPVTLLNLLGKKIAGNILAYQHMDAVVGISPLARGLASMPGGYRQAGEASKWHGWYADHRVFYAEDFSPKEEGGKVAWQEKTEQFAAWMTGGKRGEDARAIVSRFFGRYLSRP
ncbi:response regulator [Cohnella rhizosphaerae]|uniref:Response regulator n=1 Tax=Cohnella rhizosphaerae TaxID=1457232 RepID=A0A9X4L6P4_9BACL|nr:response regulator [Cohnella rhizosphaerae]MDG0814477.1 response regulator [Cohnella rhizosphaerae]